MITYDPVWPWNIPTVGWVALLGTTGLLLIAAAWTYLRAPGLGMMRAVILFLVRAMALLTIFLSLSGTSCTSSKDANTPSLVLVGIDASASMSVVRDETDNVSRWEHLTRTLKDNKDLIEELEEDHNIKLLFFRFGRKVELFKPFEGGKAEDKRTNTAELLRLLYDKYRGERFLRALLILSDGADNGSGAESPIALATRWSNQLSPVHTFAFGNPRTPDREKDIIVRSLTPPSEVPVKGKLPISAVVDALGFVNRRVRVKVLFDDKEVMAKTVTLTREEGNEIKLDCVAPPKQGEIKVTLQVHDPDRPGGLSGELSSVNNEMSTFVTITKEGLSVLVIERQERFPEVQLILPILEKDPRINAYRIYLRGQAVLESGQKDLLDLERRPYDVIILGEVSASRLQQADPKMLDLIFDRVDKQGMGLLMMGGRYSFGNPDRQGRRNWSGTRIEQLLPLDLSSAVGQESRSVKVAPTDQGLKYVLRLAETEDESKKLWADLDPLNGMSKLGKVEDPRFIVMAKTQRGEPLLVARDYGTGRVMAFGGDTTYFWRRNKEGVAAHSRFWRQVVFWLAHQENVSDQLKILPEGRRLPTLDKLGFTLSLHDKQGGKVKNASYKVKVIDPKGGEHPIAVARSVEDARGEHIPQIPGEYRIEASATGKDNKGNKVSSESKIRFLAYQDDAETARRAANHKFLRDLASAGGGLMRRPKDLTKFLKGLPKKPLPKAPPEPEKWPDWRTTDNPSPFLIGFVLFFVQLLALEWFLRRKWGLN